MAGSSKSIDVLLPSTPWYIEMLENSLHSDREQDEHPVTHNFGIAVAMPDGGGAYMAIRELSGE